MSDKQGSIKTSVHSADYRGPLASGLNRRAFLQTTGTAALLLSVAGCKPSPDNDETDIPFVAGQFDQHQQRTLSAVQLRLFPADGDGPSATDINALAYLQWALTDPDNIDDKDQAFIIRGIGWLDDLAQQTKGSLFTELKSEEQNQVLQQVSLSSEGENWMSLLLYYLIEALILDPVYGGNPKGIGWQWLKHQPGFPRPQSLAEGYRNYE